VKCTGGTILQLQASSEKKVLDFKFFHPFSLPKTGCLDDEKCKENEKKEQPAAFEPCASQFQTLP
jgi:hypothetical protein